jgi:O-acetyl-ADP-ribose deacetylase (regulator of RNase III)
MDELWIGDAKLELVQGDITEQDVDAVVNAANARLAGGGGVDGAIHRKGGSEIMEACRRIGGCPTGSAVATTAGKLPARHVIHAVGPVYRDGASGEADSLASAYTEALRVAREESARRIAFPSLSTGAYGFPVEEAAAIAVETVARVLDEEGGVFDLARFVLFDAATLEAYRQALQELSERRAT